jgi:hypothetical protein
LCAPSATGATPERGAVAGRVSSLRPLSGPQQAAAGSGCKTHSHTMHWAGAGGGSWWERTCTQLHCQQLPAHAPSGMWAASILLCQGHVGQQGDGCTPPATPVQLGCKSSASTPSRGAPWHLLHKQHSAHKARNCRHETAAHSKPKAPAQAWTSVETPLQGWPPQLWPIQHHKGRLPQPSAKGCSMCCVWEDTACGRPAESHMAATTGAHTLHAW